MSSPIQFPDPDDPEAVRKFVCEFSGYSVAGSFERCAEIAQSKPRSTYDELMIELFFFWRTSCHQGVGSEATAEFYRELLPELRRLAAERQS